MYLANCSVLWVREIGGSNYDWGGTARSADLSAISTKGIAMVPEMDMVLFAMNVMSTDIPGVPPAGYCAITIAVYSRNGTFIKFILDFFDNP